MKVWKTEADLQNTILQKSTDEGLQAEMCMVRKVN
jgi:hypothetical protein